MRLIDADELNEYIGREALDTREKIFSLVARMPTLPNPCGKPCAFERPHGMWKIDSEYGYIFHCICLKCNTDVMKYISGSENWWLNSVPNFCPNCGYDMREGEVK